MMFSRYCVRSAPAQVRRTPFIMLPGWIIRHWSRKSVPTWPRLSLSNASLKPSSLPQGEKSDQFSFFLSQLSIPTNFLRLIYETKEFATSPTVRCKGVAESVYKQQFRIFDSEF